MTSDAGPGAACPLNGHERAEDGLMAGEVAVLLDVAKARRRFEGPWR